MKFPDELFNLGDAALEDEIVVVGLALADLAGDGGQHQILYFAKILGLAQAGAGDGNAALALVDHVGMHVGIVIDHPRLLLEKRQDGDVTVVAPALVILELIFE